MKRMAQMAIGSIVKCNFKLIYFHSNLFLMMWYNFSKARFLTVAYLKKNVYDLVNNDVSVRHQNNRSRNIYFYKSYFVIQVDCLIHSGENV